MIPSLLAAKQVFLGQAPRRLAGRRPQDIAAVGRGLLSCSCFVLVLDICGMGVRSGCDVLRAAHPRPPSRPARRIEHEHERDPRSTARGVRPNT